MNRRRLSTVGLVCCCVVALGLLSTSMTATVHTTPDDAINLRYRDIPLGAGTVANLKSQLVPGSGTTRDAVSTGSGGAGSRVAARHVAGTGSTAPVGGAGSRSQGGTGLRTPSLLERLLDWLAWLEGLLLRLLVPLGLLVAVALVVRFRSRLVDLLRTASGAGDGAVTAAAASSPGVPRPLDEVAADYLELVSRLGLVDRPSTTPRECEARAVATGAEPASVDRLVGLYEQVRYGGLPVTDRRRASSRAALDEVLGQLRGED